MTGARPSAPDPGAQSAGFAVAVTHWEDEKTTLRCLAHLALTQCPQDSWILIDNGSRDGSADRIRAQYPELVCIRNAQNLGHAAAVNAGARRARELGYEFMIFLDNDAFVSPDSPRKLLRVFKDRPDAGIATPRILSGRRPGRIWYDGGSLTAVGRGVHDNMWRRNAAVARKTHDIEFATACAMMVRLAAFFEAGGFDESLITYADDLDFSIRLRHRGYAIVHVPEAEVTHGESQNVIAVAGKQFRDYFNMRNQLIVQWRYHGVLLGIPGIPYTILRDGILPGLVHALRGDRARVRALALGVMDFFRGKTGWGSL